jgi:Sigma-70 region 2
MADEQLIAPAPTAPAVADFTAWVADHHRPLLDFAQLVAGDASTGEDLLQIALARAYLKWSKISARGEHPLGYVRRIIVSIIAGSVSGTAVWSTRTMAFARVVAARTRPGCGDEPTSVLIADHQAIPSSRSGSYRHVRRASRWSQASPTSCY